MPAATSTPETTKAQVALIAHDKKKLELALFALQHRETLGHLYTGFFGVFSIIYHLLAKRNHHH